MSGKRSEGRWFVLLILAGVGLGALLLFRWQPLARAGDTSGEPVPNEEAIGELHPQNSDFAAGKEGRILISTKNIDDQYWTVVPTTKADKPAQTVDRKVTISAYVVDSKNNPAVGVTVYFRVVDPDPDDPSSYEPDTDPGDNRDGAIQAGTLSAGSDVTVLKTIAGTERAVAEVELTITNQYSGDNYIVEASLYSDFPADKTLRTALLTAWKRIYFERDRMYKRGATVTMLFTPDGDDEDDYIHVDNTDDFNEDDVVEFFEWGDPFYFIICETTVRNKGSDENGPFIIVPDMAVSVSQYAGVRLKGDNDTYDDVDLRYFGQCYGDDFRGNEHDGCFVEYSQTGIYGSGPIPKYSYLFLGTTECKYFLNNWFHNRFFKENCFYLVSVGQANHGGWAEESYHFCVLSIERLMIAHPDHWEITRDEIACHEIGHHFVEESGHVDTNDPVWNHDHSDYCIMSYAQDPENAIIEFCADHCYEVRDDVDPRQ